MNTQISTDDFIDPLATSLRENRLVMERLVQWKGVTPGLIFSVMDCAVFALALDLISHTDIEMHLDQLAAPSCKVSVSDTEERIVVDAGGRHAWLIAESALDLAIAAYRVGGPEVIVTNIAESDQLGVVAAIAEKHHLSAVVEQDVDGWRIVVSHENAGHQSALDLIRRKGIEASHKRWFELLALSSNALATDTLVSRTHTGSFIINPDGSVIGRREHEFAYDDDISMLTAEKLEFRR
ncbi:hypothetical protein QBK99_05395 [Corticibacterium sp. UT-5YL-CI-8]|nr:hypothetical protein [Tianweitania sp. UT-5YL-CI-8]